MYCLSQTLVTLTTKLIFTLSILKELFQIRDQMFNSPYILNNLGSFSFICWVEFPFHVLFSSSSSSLLWSHWIPPSFFTDQTSPRTLWMNCHEKNKIKKKNGKKDWHVTLGRKEFRCCSWLWIWLGVCLFHYLFNCYIFLITKKSW